MTSLQVVPLTCAIFLSCSSSSSLSCRSPSSESALPAVDGFYIALPELFGDHESVEIRGESAWWNAHLPDGHPDHATGLVRTDSERGEIELRWPGGSAIATYAVLDGHLWLGVMRREGDSARWHSRLEGEPGPAGRPAGPPPLFRGSVSWDQERASLRLEQANRVVAIEGVGQLRRACKLDDRRLGRAAAGDLEGHACNLEPSSRRAPWLRKGSVMLTPWSVRLGPAGMLPEPDARALLGDWRGEKRTTYRESPVHRQAPEEYRLSVVGETEKPGEPFHFGLSSLTPAPGPRAVPNSDRYRPNARGIVFSPYGWDCAMGHFDQPGYVAWFPIEGDRLFAHHRHATHGSLIAAAYILEREDVGP